MINIFLHSFSSWNKTQDNSNAFQCTKFLNYMSIMYLFDSVDLMFHTYYPLELYYDYIEVILLNCFTINRSRLNLGIVSQDIYSHTHITELHKTCPSFLISIPPREFEDMKMWDTHSITILKSFSISFIYVVFLWEDRCVDEILLCSFAHTNIG